jgi:hypothetical protein
MQAFHVRAVENHRLMLGQSQGAAWSKKLDDRCHICNSNGDAFLLVVSEELRKKNIEEFFQ